MSPNVSVVVSLYNSYARKAVDNPPPAVNEIKKSCGKPYLKSDTQ